MKVSIHTASRIDTRLAVARVSRVRLGFMVRVRVRAISRNSPRGLNLQVILNKSHLHICASSGG